MTENTWPNPARPGVPRDPHQSGWHWLSGATERPAAFEWLAHKQAWLFHRAQPEAQAMPPPAFGSWTYLGPVLTPDEAAVMQARADRNAAGFARVDAEAERDKFLHKQKIAALQKRAAELEGALREMVYEATHLSPEEDDGSHWCKISKGALVKARAALTGGKDE